MFVYSWVCVYRVCAGDWLEALDPLELEVLMVVSHHVGSGDNPDPLGSLQLLHQVFFFLFTF